MNADAVNQPISKEQARMLVAEIGYTETSNRTGIKRDTLYQWARRFSWNQPIAHSQELTVRSVRQAPAQAHSEALADLEGQTRMSLAKSAQRMAKDAEQATLRESPYVHKAAQVAGLVHGWSEGKTEAHFTLNTLNISALPLKIGKEEEDVPTYEG